MYGDFGNCTGVGIVQDNTLLAGVVYYAYRHPNIEMSIASVSPKWCTRSVLRHLFNYPFNQLGCERITVFVDADNQAVQKFDERLGFVREGVLRKAHPRGDAIIYGMLKSECRWI